MTSMQMIFRAYSASSHFNSISRRHLATRSNFVEKRAPLDIHPEVQHALANNVPVVALETALVTHGLPRPENLATATSLEGIVRSTGSVPATIGIIDGRVKIGLTAQELERLADTANNPSNKISRRDIAPAIALKKNGGTTCSATLIFAALAGIKVFATGGLGGVHRGGENSMDISADLTELTRCPVGLVSAGVKSILDIGRTLEYLETLGVPVLSYSNTHDFPAFFSPRSGFQTNWRVNDPRSAASVLFTQWQLGMSNGALFAVPIPEEYEERGASIQQAVEQAIVESEGNGISRRGNEVTPWILRRVEELTEGESLPSNIALLKNTALAGGKIAMEYSKLTKEHSPSAFPNVYVNYPGKSLTTENAVQPPQAKLMVIGSAAIDISAQVLAPQGTDIPNTMGTTHPGTVSLSLGGVARNIAEAAHRVMTSQADSLCSGTLLVSPVGQDSWAVLLREGMKQIGLRTDGLLESAMNTSTCSMVLDSAGSLVSGVADMDIVQSLDIATVLDRIKDNRPKIVALDGNLSQELISAVVRYCNNDNINVFFEPTSLAKSTAILPAIAQNLSVVDIGRSPITFASPNLLELSHMYNAAQAEPTGLMSHARWWTIIDGLSLGSQYRTDLERLARRNVSDLDSSKGTLSFLLDEGVALMAVNLLPFFQTLIIKCGEFGVITAARISRSDVDKSGWANLRSNANERYVIARGTSQDMLVLQHQSALHVDTKTVLNVTGAGDSLVGSVLADLVESPTLFHSPASSRQTLRRAQRAAVLTLQSRHAVSHELSRLSRS